MAKDRDFIVSLIGPAKRILTVAPDSVLEIDLHRTASIGIQTGGVVTGASYEISVGGNDYIAGSALSINSIVKIDTVHLKSIRITVGAADTPIVVCKSTMV